MLGNVARKLRVFGYDTAYMAHTHDDEVIKVGEAEARTILTADKELFKRIVARGMPGVLVDCRSEFEDLVHILSKSGINSIALVGDAQQSLAVGSRCSLCNGPLQNRTPSEVEETIPAPLLTRHDRFYKCVSCDKVYWQGGHFRRLHDLANRINTRLAEQRWGTGTHATSRRKPAKKKAASGNRAKITKG